MVGTSSGHGSGGRGRRRRKNAGRGRGGRGGGRNTHEQQSSHADGNVSSGPSSPSSPSSSSISTGHQPLVQGTTGQSQNQTQRPLQSSSTPPPSADSVGQILQSMKISEQEQLLSSPEERGDKILPLRRPDWGTFAVRSVSLLANHFLVRFNQESTIIHYNLDVKQDTSAGDQSSNRSIPMPLLRLIKEQLFSDKPHDFPANKFAYDGNKNIFSAVQLPVGEFDVKLSVDEAGGSRSYMFTINEVNRLQMSKLNEYLEGNLLHKPTDILQGMEMVMKENPKQNRTTVGKSFYCKNYSENDDLGCGIAAYRGFHQSLKPTSQGLALCLDYSVLALRKPIPVLEFLMANIENFAVIEFLKGNIDNDIIRRREEVVRALEGLKVRVTHRITKQKYTISGLSDETTRNLSFDLVNLDFYPEPIKFSIVDYFLPKYGKMIHFLDIPCLDLGKEDKNNYVPMEFCVLVEGQRYPKEDLNPDRAKLLKDKSLVVPQERMSSICEMVQAEDGPGGNVAESFGMEVEKNMTSVEGRVLDAPELKLRAPNGGHVRPLTVDQEKREWNLAGNSVVEGQRVERWALIEFTDNDHSELNTQGFIKKLKNRSLRLGMHMENPLICQSNIMEKLSSVSKIQKLLRNVIASARKQGRLKGTQLQLIVCVMTKKDIGYKYLKWVSETQIGVVTQCCLSSHASKGDEQYLANLCLKINAKVGGSNVELIERLPNFVDEDIVMFIGADVNHPAAGNTECPSIAAVVGTLYWPASNRYAARIQPQENHKEKIVNFGSICRDLVDTFVELNDSRPNKIIVFRDGVSEGQFDMVLNEELPDLMQAICDVEYQPTITLVVAQKRHRTRLFLDRRDGDVAENVPPGTVVDTKIVHPFEFDFYLCSHYGSQGTSKPTHYYVLWDQNKFTSDNLQKLIYNLCFTYARCAKPVSLVPPVYYAHLAAYRGRLFREVEEVQRSSAASFDQSFYTLHSNLKNAMFFI